MYPSLESRQASKMPRPAVPEALPCRGRVSCQHGVVPHPGADASAVAATVLVSPTRRGRVSDRGLEPRVGFNSISTSSSLFRPQSHP
jgi:hypothetical protein